MRQPSEHTFHIPVMGIAFTIDSPIKVARFGISSVISIIEDRLIEMMRNIYMLFNRSKKISFMALDISGTVPSLIRA